MQLFDSTTIKNSRTDNGPDWWPQLEAARVGRFWMSAEGCDSFVKDDSKLHPQTSSLVNLGGALRDEAFPCPVQYEHCLLLNLLNGNKARVGRTTTSQIASASAASFLLLFA
jgi:hypothetical protein